MRACIIGQGAVTRGRRVLALLPAALGEPVPAARRAAGRSHKTTREVLSWSAVMARCASAQAIVCGGICLPEAGYKVSGSSRPTKAILSEVFRLLHHDNAHCVSATRWTSTRLPRPGGEETRRSLADLRLVAARARFRSRSQPRCTAGFSGA